MKMKRKYGLLVSAFLFAAGMDVSVAATATAPQYKVAVVNVQQVLQQSPKVAELSKKLENDFKARQTKIADEQKSLQDELDKIKKDSPTMSQKDKDAAQKKAANDRAELVKKVVAYQQDLQKEQAKIMRGIQSQLNSIVSGIAKTQGYTLVLDAQAVIYANDGNDITKTVAEQFNK